MLEPCVVKLTNTVLRREFHHEMGFLFDYLGNSIDYLKLVQYLACV